MVEDLLVLSYVLWHVLDGDRMNLRNLYMVIGGDGGRLVVRVADGLLRLV